MTWDNDKQAYYGTTSDGRIVEVTGDEYAETLQYGRKVEAEQRGYDPENLTEEQRAECEDAVVDGAGLDNPDVWAALAGDNPNVEIVEKATYTEEDYLKIVHNDNYGYNHMNGGW